MPDDPQEAAMPEKKTRERAARAKREGKAPSTQAGAFVQEEIEHVREGKHGARSTAQAIAIGLSKARRAGVAVPKRAGAKRAGAKKTGARKKAATKRHTGATSAKRSRATTQALKREGRAAGSHQAVSKQARAAARKRSAASRSAAAKKAVRTKGASGRSAAARKGARTRMRRSR
jgi:hypothetical protein